MYYLCIAGLTEMGVDTGANKLFVYLRFENLALKHINNCVHTVDFGKQL